MQVSNKTGSKRNMRQTLVEHEGTYVLVITSDITHMEEGYPYETGIFYSDSRGKTLNGQISHIVAIQRADTLIEALHCHISGIAIAVDYLNHEEEYLQEV